jgi:hypothetical protein
MKILGKSKKLNGVWLLKPFGFKDFPLSGKHYASVYLGNDVWLNLFNLTG